MFFHQSQLPITAREFLQFSLITSEILLLIDLRCSSLLREILDFTLSIDLTNRVIQTGSHDDIQMHLNSIHLSIRVVILSSMRLTATSIFPATNTILQSSDTRAL